MNFPKELGYTKTHEWVQKLDGDMVRIGLTDYAQSELGDIVFVNLPAEGDTLAVGDSFGDVESVKAVSDVYSPASGVVAAVNTTLEDDPAQINSAPYEAWLLEIGQVGEVEELLSAEEYEALIAEEG